jgi:Tfp pilus assembly protein FimT
MVAYVRYSAVGRSRGRVTSCVVCTMHIGSRSAGFLVVPENQGGGGFLGLGLKIGGYGLVI